MEEGGRRGGEEGVRKAGLKDIGHIPLSQAAIVWSSTSSLDEKLQTLETNACVNLFPRLPPASLAPHGKQEKLGIKLGNKAHIRSLGKKARLNLMHMYHLLLACYTRRSAQVMWDEVCWIHVAGT